MLRSDQACCFGHPQRLKLYWTWLLDNMGSRQEKEKKEKARSTPLGVITEASVCRGAWDCCFKRSNQPAKHFDSVQQVANGLLLSFNGSFSLTYTL